ncbi:Uncharacterised protein [Mycobacteroides abscessus subsp. abscessus]|nr:Uncharacterised protein [Mycobacteroides abscessus subsp. abscessus]
MRMPSPARRTVPAIPRTADSAVSLGSARTNSAAPPRSSATVDSVTRRPFAMTPTRSQISWTSLSRWLDSSTVCPSPASPAISALVGSSRISRSGRPSRAAPTPSRCFIPSE